MIKYIPSGLIILLLIALPHQPAFAQQIHKKPNVIFVLIDDEGIGDIECLGNPWLKTPNINKFYKESVHLSNYHTSPLCTPTRSGLMTGQYPIHNGAWATFKGRDNLSINSPKIAQFFKENGYITGMFGKWHLGDNYPSRPMDCGFDYTLRHKSGGVGEISDYWGNDYFNDTYLVNEKPKKFSGYCTDIWFDQAMNFIKKIKNKNLPFFIYLPTNLVHAPLIIADKYVAPYYNLEGKKIPSAKFYGMMANVDENFGRLVSFLKINDLENNTILIYSSDNGTKGGYDPKSGLGFNGPYRGIKGDVEEGGHIEPFFIRWPDGNIRGERDLSYLASNIDVFPTLATLCNLTISHDLKNKLDGLDLSNVLLNKNGNLKDRFIFLHNRQDYKPPFPEKHSAVLYQNWRLLNGKELYNITEDKQERNNVLDNYPEVAQKMKAANFEFFSKAQQQENYKEIPPTIIDPSHQKLTALNIQHAVGDDNPIWKQEQIAEGIENRNDAYAISVAIPGKYQITCTRWPIECPGPIVGIPIENPEQHFVYKAIHPQSITINVFNRSYTKPVLNNKNRVVFDLTLMKGKTTLYADFNEMKKKYGVYYIYIKKI